MTVVFKAVGDGELPVDGLDDANWVFYPYLAIGSKPDILQLGEMSEVWFCALEYQPDWPGSGPNFGYSPNLDDRREGYVLEYLEDTITSAGMIARDITAGKERILVTCMGGINRSALLCALVCHRLKGWSGKRCIEYIRKRRPGALDNPAFVSFLENLR